MKKYLILFLIMCLNVLRLYSLSPLNDPYIPHGENIRYILDNGGEKETVFQKVERLNGEGQDLYKVEMSSPRQEVEVRIVCRNLLPISTKRLQKNGRAGFLSYSELESIPPLNEDEILIVDFSDLAHVLRGYPFDDPLPLELVFPYQPDTDEKKNISFRIKFIKREKIKLISGTHEAYKLQLSTHMSGGMAVFGGMMPKNYFWYSTEAPHYLLKYEGNEAPGTTDRILMEMVSYSVAE